MNQKDGNPLKLYINQILCRLGHCSLNSSQKMEGVLAENQFVWSFVASVSQIWELLL